MQKHAIGRQEFRLSGDKVTVLTLSNTTPMYAMVMTTDSHKGHKYAMVPYDAIKHGHRHELIKFFERNLKFVKNAE